MSWAAIEKNPSSGTKVPRSASCTSATGVTPAAPASDAGRTSVDNPIMFSSNR